MKILCPLCGVQGHLQVRGNSQRVLHYKGFVDGKRMYERHRMEINGNQQMEINKSEMRIFSQNKFAPIAQRQSNGFVNRRSRVQIPPGAPVSLFYSYRLG
jgi:hypothetical protein